MSICPNNPGPKKMGRTYLSKIPTISSNPHTIMLLLIVGEFGYPEVHKTADQDRAIRNKLEEILMSINRRASSVKNPIKSIFWMCFVPDLNFVEEILIESPGLPWG